jgi:hypothetical protein
MKFSEKLKSGERKRACMMAFRGCMEALLFLLLKNCSETEAASVKTTETINNFVIF